MDDIRETMVRKMFGRTINCQQPGTCPFLRRLLGNEFKRKIVVKVGKQHRARKILPFSQKKRGVFVLWSQAFFLPAFIKTERISIGIGKSVVELFSVATSDNVCR